MGWVTQRSRPGLSAEDLQLIFELEEGTISEPQMRDREIVIFQIVQKSEGQTKRFEDVRTSIEHQILRERRAHILERTQSEARETADLVIDRDTLRRQEVVYCAPPELKMPGTVPIRPPQR